MIQCRTQGTLCIFYKVTCLACSTSVSCAFFTMISTNLTFSIFWIEALLTSDTFSIRITEGAMFNIKASLAYLLSDKEPIFTGQTAIFCRAFYAVFRASNTSPINQFESFFASSALALWITKETMRSSAASCTLFVLHKVRVFTFCTSICFCAF